MEYTKPHLSLSQQAELLTQGGLVADKSLLILRLKDVGYYRLSAYLHPFRARNRDGQLEECFVPETTLEKVWNLYLFDRKLRFMLLDAIERIEVALRSRLAYLHTENRTPFSYADESYFPQWKGYIQSLERVRMQRDKQGKVKSRGVDSIDHFFRKYGDMHEYLPLWIAVSELEFGTIVHFYQHSDKKIRKSIADGWKTDTATLLSWLSVLRSLRNDCAHHSRIWNKAFPSRPKLNIISGMQWNYVYSEKAKKWVKPTTVSKGKPSLLLSQETIAPLLFICRYLLRQVAPTSHWHERMQDFLLNSQNQGVPLLKMGLPPHWTDHPLWT